MRYFAVQHKNVAYAASSCSLDARSIHEYCKLRLRKLPMSDFVWDDLKYFMTVAVEGSVAGAARVLKVEHSTVVRRITRLESALNVRLFNRFVRGWVLTGEGCALQAQAVPVEAQMMNVQRFTVSLGEMSGPVVLTAPPDLLSEVVSPALIEFQRQYPNIELSLIGDLKAAKLSRGEADIALRMSKVEGAELVTQRICDVSYQFYGSHKVSGDRPENRRFIGYLQAYQPYISDVVLQQAAGRTVAFQTNNLRTALQAASGGVGVALLPSFLAAAVPDLRVVEETLVPVTCPVYLVMQRDMRKSKRVRVLAEYLKRKLPIVLR